MSKIAVAFAFIVFLFLIIPRNVQAVSVSITDHPQTITQEPFIITAAVENAQTGTNYLRVDIYKEGTQSYFGETYNNSDWYSGSDGKQYFPINIQSGQVWSGQVQARVGNPAVSEYSGPGSYEMRIRRYTASGSQGSGDTNNTVSVNIDIPIPTPTPTPTPTPESSTSQSSSTSSPTPTPKSSSTTTTAKSPSPKSVSSPAVLGESQTESTPASLRDMQQ